MSQAFPIVLPVALSFRMFGIGTIQGRLPMVIYALATIILLVALADKIYGRKVAIGTFVFLVAMAPIPGLVLFITGRQVLGEIPMIFFLLAGCWCLLMALEKSNKWLMMAGIFWGLEILTKRQALPFAMMAWFIPTAVAAYRRQWDMMKTMLACGIFSMIMFGIFFGVESFLSSRFPRYGENITGGLYRLAVFTSKIEIRWNTFTLLALAGWAIITGTVFTFFQSIHIFKKSAPKPENKDWITLSLFSFTASWLLWYTFGSLGWVRYLFPTFLLSGIFFAKVAHDWTNEFNFPHIVQNIIPASSTPGEIIKTLQNVFILILMASQFAMSAISMSALKKFEDHSPYQTAEYLNKNFSPNTLVETFDGELIFLLNLPYHFPPASVQVELNRRTVLGEDMPVHYNFLQVKPDLIVIGPLGNKWGLYDNVVAQGQYKLIKQIGDYSIYENAE
jgi:hypothetical protein